MSDRRGLLFFILFVLFCELFDPTSNFIRVSTPQKEPTFTAAVECAFLSSELSCEGRSTEDNSAPPQQSLEQVSVHSCTLVAELTWIPPEFPSRADLPLRIDPTPEGYRPQVFQPPKILS